jgi:hypothetical protein
MKKLFYEKLWTFVFHTACKKFILASRVFANLCKKTTCKKQEQENGAMGIRKK